MFVPTYLHAQYFISASAGLSIKTKQMTFAECRVFAAAQYWPSLSRVQRQTFWRNKHPEYIQFCSDLICQPGQSTEIFLSFLLLRFKSGFIFAPVYQPDCSGDPGRSSRSPGVYVLWFWLPALPTRVSGERWVAWELTWSQTHRHRAHLYGSWTVRWSRCIDEITLDNYNDKMYLYGTLHN